MAASLNEKTEQLEVSKSKYYYMPCRNKECTKDCACKKKTDIPKYYIGKEGMMAKDVIWQFDLTYNIGTAVTYLLRARSKHDTPTDCIKKAIHHLEFELNQLENESKES